jgi:RNA polymerase sigma-70 factor (ECF subfamily)
VAPAHRRTDDVDLARRCVSGDVSAQMEVFRRQKQRVHATLYRVLGSNADMDDLVQEAFIEIFRSLPTFRGDALLSTWIDRITVRVAWAHIARRKPDAVRLSLVPEAPSREANAEDRVSAREAARRLYAILDRIEPNQRIAYTLHVIDGRPIPEVARVMNASVVTTKVRAWRAARLVEKRAKHDPLLAAFVGEAGVDEREDA